MKISNDPKYDGHWRLIDMGSSSDNHGITKIAIRNVREYEITH